MEDERWMDFFAHRCWAVFGGPKRSKAIAPGDWPFVTAAISHSQVAMQNFWDSRFRGRRRQSSVHEPRLAANPRRLAGQGECGSAERERHAKIDCDHGQPA